MGYLLAGTNDERRAVLAAAAIIPDNRVRMLIGACRDWPSVRAECDAASEASNRLLARGQSAKDADGKSIPASKLYGANPYDTPYATDIWENDTLTGRWSTTEAASSVSIDIVAYPSNNYKALLHQPGAKPSTLIGFAQPDGSLLLLGKGARGVLCNGVLTFTPEGGSERTLRRGFIGKVFPEKRPADAIVLLDETTGLRNFQHAKGDAAQWTQHAGGVVEIAPRTGSIYSQQKFGDARIYLEFRHALNRETLGSRRGNSGVYVMDTYEVQLADSFGSEPGTTSEGAIYRILPPSTNASAAPLEWQSMEIEFRSPRFDAEGNKTTNARMTVWQNGVKIHDDIEVPNPTASSAEEGRKLKDPQPPRPLRLQDHRNRVQFRNIWVLPLEAGKTN